MKEIKFFEHLDNNKNYNINVFYYVPEGDVKNMPVVMVMHGCCRDALDYIKPWVEYADRNKIVVLAPEFARKEYSICEYDLGGLVKGAEDFRTTDIYTPIIDYNQEITNETEWTFHNLDEIYVEFANMINANHENGYILYGHSSGAQFVHRAVLLGGLKYLNYAVAANAGLYMMLDEKYSYPHGIKNMGKHAAKIENGLGRKAYVLVGSLDVGSQYLHNSQLDMLEGDTRIERAKNFYNKLTEYAKNNNIKHNWSFGIMDNVKHNNVETIPFVIDIINNTTNKKEGI